MSSVEVLEDGQIKELSAPFIGSLTALNPFLRTDSGARLAMMAGHIPQALILKGATRRRIYTGDEAEYAKATFSVDMPSTGQVLRIIEKYPTSGLASQFKVNPEITVVYEDFEARRRGETMLGVVNIPTHWCLHQQFGFKYNRVKSTFAQLAQPKAIIPRGTPFAMPPDVTPDGNWMFGIESNVIYMTIPQIIEDGFAVRRGWLQHATATAISSRMASWGKSRYALNLYGDENTYKPFPEPGDKIREDGVLFALRPYTKFLGITDMTPKALMTYDPVFDELTFVEPNAAGAVVIDVKVMHDQSQPRPPTPYGMSALCEKYLTANRNYANKLIDVYREATQRDRSTTLDRPLHQQMVHAIDQVPERFKIENNASRTFRATPLDDWTVEIKYSYDYVPGIGSKITNLHGGKGVIVDIWEDEDMPRDRFGRIADVIKDPDSVGKRMNDGCFYEQYCTSSMWQMTEQIKELARVAGYEKAYETLIDYYGCVSTPMQYRTEQTCRTPERRMEHVDSVIRDGIYMYMPSGTPQVGDVQIRNIMQRYPLLKGPVTYRGRSGNISQTHDDIIIGSMYIMLLEKTGTDWSALSSLKQQHHGVPAKLTQRDKYALPWREQANRSIGEAEARLMFAYVDRMVVLDMLEFPNSPQAQRHIARVLLTHDTPTNVETIVDRNIIKRGTSRALLFVKHILECAGIWFAKH